MGSRFRGNDEWSEPIQSYRSSQNSSADKIRDPPAHRALVAVTTLWLLMTRRVPIRRARGGRREQACETGGGDKAAGKERRAAHGGSGRLLFQPAALVIGDSGDAKPDRRPEQLEDPFAALVGERRQNDPGATENDADSGHALEAFGVGRRKLPGRALEAFTHPAAAHLVGLVGQIEQENKAADDGDKLQHFPLRAPRRRLNPVRSWRSGGSPRRIFPCAAGARRRRGYAPAACPRTPRHAQPEGSCP